MNNKFLKLVCFLLALVPACLSQGPQNAITYFPVFATNPSPVPSASVQRVGNPGPQTYYYWLATEYLVGQGPIAGPFIGASAPNTLSGSNFFTIAPTYPVGVVSVDLLRTTTPITPSGACACAVATGVTSGVINDQSNSLSAFTVNPVSLAALKMSVANEVQSANVTHLILRQNGVFVCDLSVGCAGGGTITGATLNGGLLQTGTTLGLLTSCSTNQVEQWNGTAWVCATVSGGGGTTTITTYLPFENCVPDQTGNSFYTVTALSTWFAGHWEFNTNTSAFFDCMIQIPAAVAVTPNASIILNIAANDNSGTHTANYQTCDNVVLNVSGVSSLNVGALTCAVAQLYTTTTTAYSRVPLTFAVQSTVAGNNFLIVKIATTTTGTAPGNNMFVYPYLKIDQLL